MARYRQVAFHGGRKNFEAFNSAAFRSGADFHKYGLGFYFSTDPDVAQQYRMDDCALRDTDVVYMYESGHAESITIDASDELMHQAAQALMEHGLEQAIEIASEAANQPLARAISSLEQASHSLTEARGVVYKVSIPAEHELMDWNSEISEDLLIKIAHALIPRERIERSRTWLEQNLLQPWQCKDPKALSDRLIVRPKRGYLDEQKPDLCPGASWSEFYEILGSYHMGADDDFSGSSVYAYLTHCAASEPEAIKILISCGTLGFTASDSHRSALKHTKVISIFRADDIKVLEKGYDAQTIERWRDELCGARRQADSEFGL